MRNEISDSKFSFLITCLLGPACVYGFEDLIRVRAVGLNPANDTGPEGALAHRGGHQVRAVEAEGCSFRKYLGEAASGLGGIPARIGVLLRGYGYAGLGLFLHRLAGRQVL